MTETYFEPSEFQLELRRDLAKNYSLNLPDDISEIVHRFFPWKTSHDLENTVCYYYRMLRNQTDQKIDIHAELSKLEDFSAILGRLCDTCLEVHLVDQKRLAQPFYALIEQVPSIKDDPSYEYLTTDYEKFKIEKALEQKPREEHIQVTQQSLSSHLEVLRRELQKIDRGKIVEANQRMSIVNYLRDRVNSVIEALKLASEFSKMLKDSESMRESTMTRFQQVGYRSEAVTNKFPGFSRL